MRITFGDFTLDDTCRALMKGDGDVHLSLKAYELLKLLIVERPRVLAKTELHERLWPDTFVSDSRLASVIAEVRSALGERARKSRFIRTAHGFGYGFASEVVGSAPLVDAASGSRQAATPRPDAQPMLLECWLSRDDDQFPLRAGENIIGRGRQATVSIDSLSVSRRHARIVVTRTEAVLEDLGSRNGTRLRSQPITAPVKLRDGDLVQAGVVAFVFHMVAADASTTPLASDPTAPTRT